MKAIVRLIDRGYVIIPEKVREAMGIKKGDLLEINIEKIDPPEPL